MASAIAAVVLTFDFDVDIVAPQDFARQLVPDTVEVHETGYAEVHFGDGGLFAGHGVGVRIKPDGFFQEAVVEG